MSDVVRVRAPRRKLLHLGLLVLPMGRLTMLAWWPRYEEPEAWMRVIWCFVGIVLAVLIAHEVLRPDGVDLRADTAVVVSGFRTREVPWRDVQAIAVDGRWVKLYRSAGKPIRLSYPARTWLVPRSRFEADYHRIGQWWIAHRSPDRSSPAPIAAPGLRSPGGPV